MMLRIATLAFVLLFPLLADARPPPDAEPNMDRSVFFRSLHRDSDNFPCCSDSDCRSVEGKYRFNEADHHYYVTVEKKKFVLDKFDDQRWESMYPGKSEVEMMVPIGDVTIRTDNPTGGAILCYSTFQNTIYCFVPWDTLE